MVGRYLIACLLTLASILPAPARGAAQSQSDDALVRAVRGVGIGTRIRVSTTSVTMRHGEILGFDRGDIVWQDLEGVARVTGASELARLDVRRRAWRKGMVVGGGVGALSGVFLGLLSAAACEGGQGCSGDALSSALNGGAFLALAGGGLGAAVGLAIPEWRTVYATGSAPADTSLPRTVERSRRPSRSPSR